MKNLLAIGLGGFLGSTSRYLSVVLVDRWIGQASFPWAIFGVNLVGCYLLGILYGVGEVMRPLPEVWRLGIGVGFLGGFTTFSTYGLQSLGLFQQGRVGLGMVYTVGSVIGGLVAVWAGIVTVNGIRGGS